MRPADDVGERAASMEGAVVLYPRAKWQVPQSTAKTYKTKSQFAIAMQLHEL